MAFMTGQIPGLASISQQLLAVASSPDADPMQRAAAVQQLQGMDQGQGLGSMDFSGDDGTYAQSMSFPGDEMGDDEDAYDMASDDMIQSAMFDGSEAALDASEAGLGAFDSTDSSLLTPEDKWLALAKAGLGAMASGSPYAAQAIGQGGLVGIEALNDLRKQRALERLKTIQQEQLGAYRQGQLQNAQVRNALLAQRGTGTALERNLIAAGLKPGTPEFEAAMIKGVTRPLVSLDPGNKGNIKEQEALGESRAASSQAAREAAEKAARIKSNVNQFREVLNADQFQTGALSGPRKFIGELAVLAGADPTAIPIVGDPRAAGTLESLSQSMAADTLSEMEGIRGTNLGIKLTQDTVANLTRTPGGNRLILDLKERMADQSLREDEMWSDYRRNPGVETYDNTLKRIRESRGEFDKETRDLVKEMTKAAKDAPKSWDEIVGKMNKPMEPMDSFSESEWAESAKKRGITVEEAKRRYKEALGPGVP